VTGRCREFLRRTAIGAYSTVLALTAPQVSGQEVETLLGFHTSENKLIFQVQSHGCTDKGDFDLRVMRADGSAGVSVTLMRRKPDTCKGFFRGGAEISFSREELGLTSDATVRTTNPEVGRPK